MIDKKLKQEILAMVKKDQAMRQSGKWDKQVDKENTRTMKKLIKKHGWLDNNLVGVKGAENAWLLVQHAGHDIKFQKQCLNLMREKAKNGLISPRHVAYLTDRILVNEDKPQFFGTQFHVNQHGKFVPQQIRNRKGLGKRRKEYGLEPFERYKKRLTKKHQALRKTVNRKKS